MRHKKRTPGIRIVVLIVILVFLVGFYMFWKGISDKNNTSKTEISTDQTIISSEFDNKSNEIQETVDTSISEIETTTSKKENNLTAAEFKDWVQAILFVFGANNVGRPQYIIHEPVIDSDTQLSSIRVEIPQVDDYGTFRVNSNGQLEAIGRIAGSLMEWQVLSNYYKETDTAEKIFSERNEKNLKNMEDNYYNQIKEAMDKQSDYIKSLPPGTQVQSSVSAAIAESEKLFLDYPDQKELIGKALDRVLEDAS